MERRIGGKEARGRPLHALRPEASADFMEKMDTKNTTNENPPTKSGVLDPVLGEGLPSPYPLPTGP